jgi:hypothetical protein
MSTNTRNWAQTEAYKRISGLCLQPHVLALTGMWVVTQEFGQIKIFGRNPNCSYVMLVITPGSTVFSNFTYTASQ